MNLVAFIFIQKTVFISCGIGNAYFITNNVSNYKEGINEGLTNAWVKIDCMPITSISQKLRPPFLKRIVYCFELLCFFQPEVNTENNVKKFKN